ncbi:MAG TPA: Ig-like domain-containing protein [Thermoanaerobaculia bacterium]
MMRRSLAVVALLLAACQGESPTSPQGERAARAEATSVHGITVLPDTTVLQAGKSTTASASATLSRPFDITFQSSDPAVATVAGKIGQGQLGGTLQIHGVSAGTARITYTIPNFGRPPGSGVAGSVEVTVAEPPPPPPCAVPSLTSPTAHVMIRSGESASLSVRAEGTVPMVYQWFHEGAPINGATSRIYDTPPLTRTTTFSVRAQNRCGSRTSETMTVAVMAPKRRAAGR